MSKNFNPTIHHRRSIRLKGYDYSQAGLYFVTICVQNGMYLFGDVVDGKMVLNEYGKITKNEWLKTTELRKNVQLHQFVVMPNHFHAIIEITENVVMSDVGANCIRPNENETDNLGECNSPLRSPSQTVGAIVRGYKSAVSRQIGFPVWQRNYHEHIIRDRNAHAQIAEYIENNPQKAEYIENNPQKWETDCYHTI